MRAWYLDDPAKALSLEDLQNFVKFTAYPARPEECSEELLKSLMKEKGYHSIMPIWGSDGSGKYKQMVNAALREHKHAIEEIRYVERGVDWLDVRDIHDNWVRIEMTTGDLAILPSNTYHRAVFRQEPATVTLVVPDEKLHVPFFREA